ncbi:MAG: winged helix DNA-binding domain-containing protein [Actinomycetota bacterium]|nr:winged helix DNA-binding domain-containing protein [Actinomycetota bacterium]
MLHRYLKCYGPTTSGHFAEWAGIAKSDAKQRWSAVAGAVVAVWNTRKGFVLEEDFDALDHPPAINSVRLLPAKDAFLQARDRDVVFPDPAIRRAVFPTIGGPGVVLHQALPVGTWRGAVKASRYVVTVAPFAPLTKATWAEIEAEAERVAQVRGHQEASVVEAPRT